MGTRSQRDSVGEWLASLRTTDGFYCVDRGQRIIHWGPSAEQILGYSAEEVIGRPCYEVIGGRDWQNLMFCRPDCPVLANARRGRPSSDYDLLTLKKDGSEAWINVSVLVLRGKRGQSPIIGHLFRDVTARRRIERIAQRAVETLQELVREPDGGLPDGRQAPTPPLSRRELQVLQLLASGLGTRQIAENLGVSPITARNHITHVLSKLGAKNRLEAVVYASRRHLI